MILVQLIPKSLSERLYEAIKHNIKTNQKKNRIKKFSEKTFSRQLHFMLYTKIKNRKPDSIMTQQNCINLKHPNRTKKFSEKTLKNSYTLCYAPGNTSKVLQENFKRQLHFMLYTKIKSKRPRSLMTLQNCINLKNIRTE